MNYLITPVFKDYEQILEQTQQETLSVIFYNLYLAFAILAILPSICEELFFRGFMFSGIQHRFGKPSALIFSSLFFGLMHTGTPVHTILMVLFGFLLGILLIITGSIIIPILIHFLYNTLVIISLINQDYLPGISFSYLLWGALLVLVLVMGYLIRRYRLISRTTT